MDILYQRGLTYFIASVWLINGLICKVLNFAPRHEQIVSQMLNNTHSRLLVVLIGLLEILMAIWILSRFRSRLNATVQIIVVIIMNILEYGLVPEMLLWGRLNIVFATMFVAIVYYNEYILNTRLKLHTEV